MHMASKYRDSDAVDTEYAHRLVAQCVQRHGHTTDGGSWVMVCEKDDTVEGFIIGLLDRVYHIGKRLCAYDLFLYCTPRSGRDMAALVDSYFGWADNNPRVGFVKASWTDAVKGASRMGKFYQRKGFELIGEIYERVATPQREAA
jgi:hypothetical protein